MADWTTQVADTVEGAVDVVRRRAVAPLQALARGLVYGVLAAFFLGTALALLVVAGFRALTVYLPDGVSPWASHVVVGGILTTFGVFCWTRRRPRPRE